MNKISFWASLFLLTCFFLHDCTQVPKKPDLSLSTPSWVFNIPFEDGKIFAVGSCGRTYWQIDAWKLASDDARSELAKNLQAKIRNAFLLVQSSDGTNWADKAFVVEATSSATDIVMKNSQIVALWFDEKGVVLGGSPCTTYALAVLKLSYTKEFLKPTIENKVTQEQYEKIMNAISNDFGKERIK